MAKLQLVLENVRDRHMINILEEGTTELVALKTKRFLTENLAIINKILVEEGVVDGARNHLANNWGKYAAGAAAGGALAGAATINGADGTDAIDTFNTGTGNFQANATDAMNAAGSNAGNAISDQYDAAKTGAQELATSAGAKLDAAGNAISAQYDAAKTGAQELATSAGNQYDAAKTGLGELVTSTQTQGQAGLDAAQAHIQANPAAYAGGAGALGGAALAGGAMYAANRNNGQK